MVPGIPAYEKHEYFRTALRAAIFPVYQYSLDRCLMITLYQIILNIYHSESKGI